MQFSSFYLSFNALGGSFHINAATPKTPSQIAYPIDDDNILMMKKDDTGDVKEHALDLSCPLALSCAGVLGVDQKQSHWIWEAFGTPRLRLVLWVIIFLLSLISGFLGLMGSCSHEGTILFLLLQVTVGLFVALVEMVRRWPE